MYTIGNTKKMNEKLNRKKNINMKQDIIIIGGGPAGMTAAIYALRADKKVLVLEKEVIGGKIASAGLVENYPGIEAIKGIELSEILQKQVEALGGQILPEEVIQIEPYKNQKQVITRQNRYIADVVIIATGTKYKTLDLENEEKLLGKGISFCATCDGFFYKDKIVAVIGGGNTAVSNALELANICHKVYILQLLNYLTAESILITKLKEKSNIEILYNTSVKSWIGEEKIRAIEVMEQGKKRLIQVDGVFLSIGQIPQTQLLSRQIHKTEEDYIITNEKLMTNQEGVFAAGDCVEKQIRQLTTAVNDGTIAAMNAIAYIEHLDKDRKS